MADGGRVAARVQVADDGAKLLVVDQHGGAAVGEDEGELVGDETPVRGDDDGADLGDREEALGELDAVHEQERHAVAGADPEGARARWRSGSIVRSHPQT